MRKAAPKPCAVLTCLAMATRGKFCPVHHAQAKALLLDRLNGDEWPTTPEDTAAAIAQRERIARLYRRQTC